MKPQHYLISVFVCLLGSIWGLLSPLQAEGQVIETMPVANSVDVSTQSTIVFKFSEAVNPASVPDTLAYVWGRWSGRVAGTTSLEASNTEIHFTPNRDFFHGEMVTVRLPRSVQFASSTFLDGGYTLQFWTGLRRTGFVLDEVDRKSTRLTGETFIQSYGAYSGDINEDGYVDLIVPNERTNDLRIFENDGSGNYSGSFDVVPLTNGSAPSTNEGADFNRDGHIDFAVGNSTGTTVSVFTGNGLGDFVREDTYVTGSGVRGLCTGDFNGDGWEDIITSNRVAGRIYILLNSGDGTFDDPVELEPGGSGESGCAVADYSGDGIEDLFIGNLSTGTISVMKGDGNGSFVTEATIEIDGQPWMLAAGDLNGDSVPDIVSANSSGNNVSVTLMNSDGTNSSHIEYYSGSFQLAVDLGDIDGDGDLDVVTSNFSSRDYTFWENKGAGILDILTTKSTTGAGSCMILHDRDGDGDLDATAIDELDDLLILFDNTVDAVNVEDLQEPFNIVELFPNPASEEVTVRYRASAPIEVSVLIYDMLGREVRVLMDGTVESGDVVHELDISGLSPGAYFVLSRASGATQVRSLVVAR